MNAGWFLGLGSILAGVIFGLVFLSASVGEDVANSSLKQPTAAYEIDTWGSNSEVYEFTTTDGRNCVVFILDNLRAMSMQCD